MWGGGRRGAWGAGRAVRGKQGDAGRGVWVGWGTHEEASGLVWVAFLGWAGLG